MFYGTPYCFVLEEDKKASIQLIQAVSSIVNAGRGELSSISSVIDPNALDGILHSSGDISISFEYEGFHITLHSDRAVTIRDPESLHVDLNNASNILLVAPSGDEDELCTELLLPYPATHENVLNIISEQTVDKRLNIWNEHSDTDPNSRKFITFDGEDKVDIEEKLIDESDHIKLDSDSDNQKISLLGKRISKAIEDFHASSKATTVCFHSINALLEYTDRETAFKFFHYLTSKMHSPDTIAHYHIDPIKCDRSTIAFLTPLFDAVVYGDRNITFSL